MPVDNEETRRESRPPRVANANARGKEDEEDEEEKRIAKFLCKSANAQHEKRKRIAWIPRRVQRDPDIPNGLWQVVPGQQLLFHIPQGSSSRNKLKLK